jgi:hypothetical protein
VQQGPNMRESRELKHVFVGFFCHLFWVPSWFQPYAEAEIQLMYWCEYIAQNVSLSGKKGREAAAPSNIKEIQEVQGGQEAPHDGGTIIPKDA